MMSKCLDLVLRCYRGIEEAVEETQAVMGKFTGGMGNIPGMF